MTAKLTESAIEEFAIRLLERLGYVHLHGPDIAPDGEAPERGDYAEVLLAGRLERAVARINPHLASDLRQEAIRELQRAQAPELLAGNEALHRLFTEGVPVSRSHEGGERGERVWQFDFARPENNEFVVANQFTVIENHQNKRPDLVLFVNGISSPIPPGSCR